jgi:hypothetical protein
VQAGGRRHIGHLPGVVDRWPDGSPPSRQLKLHHVALALDAGTPAPEAARGAGHRVAVLLGVYAGYIDGHNELRNGRFNQALRDEPRR